MRLFSLWIAMLSVAAAPLTAATPLSSPIFDINALGSWSTLDQRDAVPYTAESLNSEYLFGARSRQGSYVLVTSIENTTGRPALSPEELAGLVTKDTFSALNPVSFQTQILDADLAEGGKVPCVVSSFRTKKLGYNVGSSSGTALVKTVFLPMVLWDPQSGSYFNQIFVANFRGDPEHAEDLKVFDRVWTHISIPAGFSRVELERFNALQPELMARGAAKAPRLGDTRPSKPMAVEQSSAELNVSRIAGALVDHFAGRETDASLDLLHRAATAHPGTALASVITTIEADQGREFQRTVWRAAFATSAPEVRSHLVALFLAASLDRQDWKSAEALAVDAQGVALSLSHLSPGDLEALLDRLLGTCEVVPDSVVELRRFLGLGSAGLEQKVRALLTARGFGLPELAQIAEKDRRGAWRLKNHREERIPPLALDAGKLMILTPKKESGDLALKVDAVTSLIQLAAMRR